MCNFAFATMINKETIDKIMDATQIVDVVGEFVSLKKRGTNHIGCCPFHNEKTPSFYVSPSKGIYKCFGCGEAGNAVGFLMKHEHYTYPEALRYLAKKYNIEIEEEEQSDEEKARQSERDALFHVSEFAQKYFAELLYEDELGRAIGLSYFHGRGLSDEVIKKFGLGYCMDEWSNFTDHARKSGYSDAVLEKTGLTIFKEDGKSYDRFRGRVMFPIFSVSGRVLGFSGRVLSKEKQAAKYVNSPDSDIYNKGNILYGLFQAKNAIGKADKCYLVEGNVDVISMHQSGVENTVASCGTALTSPQIRLIKRYTNNITVLYDGDSAGIKATLKAVNLILAEGMHVRTVLFPDEEDPDSYAQKYGSTKLQEYLATHEENFLLYRMRLVNEEIKRDPIRKAELEKEIIGTIALVPDTLERNEYVKQCAHLFGVTEETLMRELGRTMSNNVQKAWKEAEQEVARQQHNAEADASQPTQSEQQPEVASQPLLDRIDDKLSQCEAQEQKIISLLVNSGAKEVQQPFTDEAGNPVVCSYKVSELIVSELKADDLHFDNALYQQIFDLYDQCVTEGTPLPDANYFAQSQDVVLRNKALSLMIDPYKISELWEKKGIYVAKPENRLFEDVRESIYNFKSKKLRLRMEEIDRLLKQESSMEEQMLLIAEKCELKKIQVKIEHEILNRVIV